jgi:hypothetical protein
MALSSPESNPSAYFGFTDLHGFKDFVGYVLLCAPDLFPYDDWLPLDLQMNLDRAFAGLRFGLDITEREKGPLQVIQECRRLTEDARQNYAIGKNLEGRRKLQEMDKLLQRLHSE